jgi:hypothetical protein
MKAYYLNVHYGHGTKELPNGSDAMFENFAGHMMVVGKKFPTDRKVRQELHNQGYTKKAVRSVGFFCIHQEPF